MELLHEFMERALVLGASGGHAALAASVLVGRLGMTHSVNFRLHHIRDY